MICVSQAPKKQQGESLKQAYSESLLTAETVYWDVGVDGAETGTVSSSGPGERITGTWKDSQLERVNDLERRELVSLRQIDRGGWWEVNTWPHSSPSLWPPANICPNPTKSQQKLLHGSSTFAEGAEKSWEGWGSGRLSQDLRLHLTRRCSCLHGR